MLIIPVYYRIFDNDFSSSQTFKRVLQTNSVPLVFLSGSDSNEKAAEKKAAESSVVFSTFHKSKGLERKIVVVMFVIGSGLCFALVSKYINFHSYKSYLSTFSQCIMLLLRERNRSLSSLGKKVLVGIFAPLIDFNLTKLARRKTLLYAFIFKTEVAFEKLKFNFLLKK